MEDPDELLAAVLSFADRRAGIEIVVQTGSRARGQRVDAFSDLDIELIGPGAGELAGADEWLAEIADVLVSVHLDNSEDEDIGWPTCLAVFSGGRKVDFLLADAERVERMRTGGLDVVYQRGYRVLRDERGSTADLPGSPEQLRRALPTAEEFEGNQREFWFEATQVPILLARGELWPAALRQEELRALLLDMLEWNAAVRADGPFDTWYHGHHLREWLPVEHQRRIAELFARYDAVELAVALRAMLRWYAELAEDTGVRMSLPVLPLRDRVLGHVDAVLAG